MPKPIVTLPEWASGANYVAPGKPWDATPRRDSTGLAGSAGDGFTPETPSDDPPAENENEWLHRVWEWVDTWVRLGSDAADLDDHIVETDTLGDARIARLVLGGTLSGGQSLSVSSNVAGAAASFTDTVGNFAVTASTSGALAALRASNTGTGPGVEGRSIGSTGPGVLGDAGSAGNAGVEGDGGSNGHGVQGVGGSTLGHGVQGTAIASGQMGVRGVGHASPSSSGVQGVAGDDGAAAISGVTTATASTSARAVVGVALADGTGVHGQAVDGYGVVAVSDTMAPTRAALRIAPQDADPTTDFQGDVVFNSGENQLKVRDAGGWQGVWSTPAGFVHSYDKGVGGSSNSGVFNSKAAAAVTPALVGTVIIEVSFKCGGTALLSGVDYEIFDLTAGVSVTGTLTQDIFHSTGDDQEASVAMSHDYVLPNTDPRTFQLRLRRSTAAGNFSWGEPSIEVRGVYA